MCFYRAQGISTARVLSWVFCLLVSVSVSFGSDPSGKERRIYKDVAFLASDQLEGRGVGTRGLDIAADYISEQMNRAAMGKSFAQAVQIQKFQLTVDAELGDTNHLTLVGPGGEIEKLILGTDFVPLTLGTDGVIEGEIVFAGYGIEAPDEGYDDFDGLDLEGKVVLVMRRGPQQDNPHSVFSSHAMLRHQALVSKASAAYQRGARAVLFVSDPYSGRQQQDVRLAQLERSRNALFSEAFSGLVDAVSEEPSLKEKWDALYRDQRSIASVETLMAFDRTGVNVGQSMPLIHVSQRVVDRLLLSALNTTLASIETTTDVLLQSQAAVLDGWRLSGEISIVRKESDIKNVLAVLNGDGAKAEETIVIGAHYDHLGYGGVGSLAHGSTEIHNGADDNASGTAGLLELARRFYARDKPLSRRLVFAAFSAEEMGIIGSSHYMQNPIVPLDQTIAMINLDMVGRLTKDKLTVWGTGTAKQWESKVTRLSAKHAFVLTALDDDSGASDSTSFYVRGIPVLHFSSGINHMDYHRPSDDVEKVNVTGIRRIVDVIEDLVVELAEEPVRPEYVQVVSKPRVIRGARPYFGSIPDFGKKVKGYAIQGVSADSPAEKGGLKGGDIIVKLGDRKIGGLEDFDSALRIFKAGETVSVTVLRRGKEKSLKVTLGVPR